MVSVVGGPPHRTELCRRGADPRHNKLKDTAGFERAMREVAMKARGECEDTDHVCDCEGDDRRRAEAGKQYSDCQKVHDENR